MKRTSIQHLLALLFDGIASGMMLMALPWSILSQGNNSTFLAILTLCCTASSFVATPLFATAIDRYSRKQILALAQLLQALAALMVVCAWYIEPNALWSLAIAQLVFWLTSDLAWGTNGAFTQEIYKKSAYAKISGQQEIVLQMTTLTAGGLGVLLLELWRIEYFALLATLLSVSSMVCYASIHYTPKQRENKRVSFVSQLSESKAIFSRSPMFFSFVALSCLSYPMMTYLSKLVPIYFSEQNIEGYWFAWWQINYGLGAILCGVMITYLLSRIPHEHLMMASVIVLALLLIILAISTSALSIVIVALFIGLFNATNRIARVNKLHEVIDNAVRGRVDGGMKLFSTLVQSMSYVLIAYLTYYDMTEFGFTVAAVVMALAAFGMWLLHRDKKAICMMQNY
ncbi:Major Facilitator Superfamily protein [Vibrio thalassae]|uniref:Major Facilitator Superfamily protein n=2 Tax=Vibrio thalassae TaxID=1243014 RepID=A0A240ELG9_9VIBR|nr:Major Facilitator Superfamily protein [Vibrio thalassae]